MTPERPCAAHDLFVESCIYCRCVTAEAEVERLKEALHAECRPEIGECYAPQPLINILGTGRCGGPALGTKEDK